ncbi:hypothetical protein EV384_5362 [Micromonospora kangleipakensis]|uniref:LPXTG-motif cell wall-anchored protein n=1 Tax=Micromonospora kangleipakensis TaxID=1077942 RepID=A0A4Q8BFF3_9ACTN|nr:hypothetical protein [Micromonospora kangleipakensis]RZU76692.1 hypothetical protein EV384_5362 [Micromonospora kangleipakensis]
MLAAVISLGSAAPAWAGGGTTINIDPADTGTTAAAFGTHRCDPNLGGGPFQGEDVWVFALPAAKQQGTFTSLTIEFATEGGPVTETITTTPAGDRAIVGDRAWIRTPAGLSSTGELVNPFALTNATAVITGTDGTFDLAQTCPATGGTPSPGLPVTGAGVSGPTLGKLAAGGGSLIVVGLVLLLAQRRRRFVA